MNEVTLIGGPNDGARVQVVAGIATLNVIEVEAVPAYVAVDHEPPVFEVHTREFHVPPGVGSVKWSRGVWACCDGHPNPQGQVRELTIEDVAEAFRRDPTACPRIAQVDPASVYAWLCDLADHLETVTTRRRIRCFPAPGLAVDAIALAKSWVAYRLELAADDPVKLRWQDVAHVAPEFVQWVIQTHGVKGETVTESEYSTLVALYTETRHAERPGGP